MCPGEEYTRASIPPESHGGDHRAWHPLTDVASGFPSHSAATGSRTAAIRRKPISRTPLRHDPQVRGGRGRAGDRITVVGVEVQDPARLRRVLVTELRWNPVDQPGDVLAAGDV